MRQLLFFALLMLSSCASGISLFHSFDQKVDSTLLAHNRLPVPVRQVPDGSVIILKDTGKKNTFILQTAPNNQAAATKTDNTGRNASQGANGGQSVVKDSGPGMGVFIVLGVLCFLAGIVATLKFQKLSPPIRV